jgi:endonuclease/exonuclease/phosphatase family metal-dependent hydrolase
MASGNGRGSESPFQASNQTVRTFVAAVVAIVVSACAASSMGMRAETAATEAPDLSCTAKDTQRISWRTADAADAVQLSRWCRAVGGPVLSAASASGNAPSLDELTVLSWNAHLAEGDLDQLIAKLRSGALTDGQPVRHFALLVQELYRRGDDVPAFDIHNRSAFAIKPRDPESPDIDDHVAALGLSIFYVPSMRNGPELREDRGNAIISTEPLLDPFALELPLARQRRVTLGAAITVRTPEGPRQLQLVDAHLEPLSSPKTLWFFKDPRANQVRSILDLLATPRFTDPSVAGVVLGGDFNTVRSGAGEPAYRLARAWSEGMVREDHRDTHMMGRLDYLFFKIGNGWSASTRRLDERFGSDHYPVIGTFSR